jgi:sugar O-acyltransferase (sialic acid O-acetyltransferase NeuD family)
VVQKSKTIYLIGYSGHGRVLMDAAIAQGLKVKGYFQDSESDQDPFLLPYNGNESDCNDDFFNQRSFILGIGDNKIRSKVYHQVKNKNGAIETISHPNASISNLAVIGEGCFLNAKSIVHIGAKIGVNTIVNTGAIIEHDCKIGAHVHIAPGATLCGNVTVGENTFIGAGATIIQGISIGSNVKVGAGSVVISDIPNNVTSVGIPSKIIVQ